MAANGITGIDHVLVGVDDLEGALEAYRRLGFTPTPRGRHIGWGTANYCLMFPKDYVELLGIVDPTQPTNNLERFLARRQGLFGLALATDDAAAAHAELEAAGLSPARPQDLGRRLELEEGAVTPRFTLVQLPPQAAPHVPTFLCQHLTPELVRRPTWLTHANGAQGIAAVTIVVPDPVELSTPYRRLFGAGAVTTTDDVLTVQTGSAALVFTSPEALPRLYPEIDAEGAEPYLAGLTLRAGDVAATARCLGDRGVPFHGERLDAVVVEPAEACGVLLEFTKAG